MNIQHLLSGKELYEIKIYITYCLEKNINNKCPKMITLHLLTMTENHSNFDK